MTAVGGQRHSGHLMAWSLDRLLIRDGIVLCHGWILGNTEGPHALHIRIAEKPGAHGPGVQRTDVVVATLHQARPDVVHAYPRHPGAARSGFIALGRWSQFSHSASRQVELVVQWPDGSRDTLDVSSAVATLNGSTGQRWLPRLRWLQGWAARAWQIGRRDGWKALFRKIQHHWARRTLRRLHAGGSSLPEAMRQRPVALIIDHDLGGGANQFRHRLVDELVAQDWGAVIYTFDVGSLQPALLCIHAGGQTWIPVRGWPDALRQLAQVHLGRIVYNTAASLPDALEVAWGLIELKQRGSTPVTVYLHDYFLVCPSQFLLNESGQCCGVPAVARCQSCLPINSQGFSSLYPGRQIEEWRSAWGDVLLVADEIVAFSRASVALLKRAYPAVDDRKIQIKPHRIDYLPSRLPLLPESEPWTIGVVGQIGYHKGAQVVQALAKAIRRRALSLRIVVIGVVEAPCDPAVVSETGPYRHEELSDLLERHRVGIVLFPSIWPETFSYVVQEMILMGVPVAAFDWGAPAERLSAYSKGLLLRRVCADYILDELQAFRQHLLQNG